MSAGLYSHVTRSNGTILTAAIYNGDHQNHITNQNLAKTGAASDNVSAMQAVFNPGDIGTENLPLSAEQEIQALRFQIKALTGLPQWYSPISVPIGPGNTVGAPSSVDDEFAQFDGTTGKLLQSSGGYKLATLADIRAANTLRIMSTDQLETASALVALTDAATVAVDWDTGINFSLTVTANRAIGNPTNGQPGTYRTILVQGNDATLRTLTFGANFLGGVPTITDMNNAKWYLLTIMCITTSHFKVTSVVAKT